MAAMAFIHRKQHGHHYYKNNNSDYVIDLNTKILDTGTHSDITFETKQGSVGAHRCVLANASPALRRLAEDSSQSKSIEMSLPALRSFLKLIYTKQVDKVSIRDNGLEVLAACVKYDLPAHAKLCVPILKTSMSVENCLAFAETAAMFDDELYKAARAFVCKHFDRVVMSEAYLDLATRKPSLAVELVRGKVERKQLPTKCCFP